MCELDWAGTDPHGDGGVGYEGASAQFESVVAGNQFTNMKNNKGCLQSRRCEITSQHCDMWDIRRFEIVEKHSHLVHTPSTICFRACIRIALRNSSLRCHISALWYEVAVNWNGNRRILGVRESASLSCRTCSGLLLTSQIRTANKFFNIIFASKYGAYVGNLCSSENDHT